MPRLARIVVPSAAHHITRRGNNRQDVFFVDDDRRVYLELLKEQAATHGLRVPAYSLMSNHVHLVAVPQTEQSLARAEPMPVSDARRPVKQIVQRQLLVPRREFAVDASRRFHPEHRH